LFDLPDGQKLVVGDLDPGTVIEIATWRGTGRPDSRTNRFMLGVSTNEDEGMPSKRSLRNRAEIAAPATNIETVPTAVTHNTSVITESAPSNQIATGVVFSNLVPEARKNQLSPTQNKNGRSTNPEASGNLERINLSCCSVSFCVDRASWLEVCSPSVGCNLNIWLSK